MTQPPLSHDEIVRAWKDEAFRASLTEEQRRYADEHFPVGEVELSDEELKHIAGGRASRYLGSPP